MYPMKKRSICPVLQFNFSIHSRANLKRNAGRLGETASSDLY
jgi:hypothetical protein